MARVVVGWEGKERRAPHGYAVGLINATPTFLAARLYCCRTVRLEVVTKTCGLHESIFVAKANEKCLPGNHFRNLKSDARIRMRMHVRHQIKAIASDLYDKVTTFGEDVFHTW